MISRDVNLIHLKLEDDLYELHDSKQSNLKEFSSKLLIYDLDKNVIKVKRNPILYNSMINFAFSQEIGVAVIYTNFMDHRNLSIRNNPFNINLN